MKKQILFIFLFFSSVLSAQNADSIVDKAAKAYETANGAKASFSMSIRSDKQQTTEGFEGEIQIKGNKFTLKTPDMWIWFDGKTQWTYMLRTEEVNVTNPEGEDLQLMNPALLLKDYKKGFKTEYKGESTSPSGKSAYNVMLYPRKKGNIQQVDLQIEKLSALPTSITVMFKDGTTTLIRILNMRTGLNQPDHLFVFNASDFPGAEVIDIR
ncbi:MAG: LolA-like putative outer membrane lipoprotein chaperone [Massilibacteroides sp.]|nr:LolA-like putative outer membrane lipoprotein chaperone [Massilibacteroides sp.]MDD3061269.1 LolA-like putative outer membrane lipoprotein chaperone [Massilibacteroides sp.]MDD4114617.1 LolA-like putative outer membrane lipoprotein chaperone [Massilibacteroides sp.]MDD4659766.1 LolA-like putative outer membrane lipoprotein chaperone [Massilibacteroides sp.]